MVRHTYTEAAAVSMLSQRGIWGGRGLCVFYSVLQCAVRCIWRGKGE